MIIKHLEMLSKEFDCSNFKISQIIGNMYVSIYIFNFNRAHTFFDFGDFILLCCIVTKFLYHEYTNYQKK